MKSNHYVAIMAGGIGSRFWPASTEKTPKQFLDILGVGKSLIRMTFERFLPLVPAERILIVTNEMYKGLVQEHLPELPVRNILCEPSRNNTGPCVAYTALRLFSENEDAVFVMAPSDHVILKEEIFRKHIKDALLFAEKHQNIVTLGIQPSRPDTGYGYIEKSEEILDGIVKVKAFKEKPNLEIAQSYLDTGNYVWNAGIFVWSAKQLIESFQENALDIISVLKEDDTKFGAEDEQEYIDRVYPNTPNISVDYAILERADNVYTIPVEIGWSDLGTWNSLHAYVGNNNKKNVLQGSVHLSDTSNSFLRTKDDTLLVVKGLHDYIVVVEDEAVLIYPKSDEQEIKSVVKSLSK